MSATANCAHGHPFDKRNTHIRADGYRECRTCSRERSRKYQERKRAERGPLLPNTHCRKGHEYSKENTYQHPNGYRRCRICRVAAQRRRSATESRVTLTGACTEYRVAIRTLLAALGGTPPTDDAALADAWQRATELSGFAPESAERNTP